MRQIVEFQTVEATNRRTTLCRMRQTVETTNRRMRQTVEGTNR